LPVDGYAHLIICAQAFAVIEEKVMLWESAFDPNQPEPAFAALVDAWNNSDARVFVLRNSGNIADTREFYTANFPQIGTPVALAEDVNAGDRGNQRTGEIWMEVRYDPRHPDAYRHSANAQPLHTDGSYIPEFPNATLMACVANAGEGGETIFIASEDIAAALQAENPALLEWLKANPVKHSRSGDERIEKTISPDADALRVNWNYYCLAKDLSAEERANTQAFFDFLNTSPRIKERLLAVKLSPGDGIMWRDREVLHGRNGFVASRESERFIWKCAIDVARFD
jgi:alpha-ketoglutarate-dependent taurine dioxygenase